jgi:hypothetical protein
MTRALCDQSASGTETAAYEITLPSGRALTLCGYHTRLALTSLPEEATIAVIGAAPVELYLPAFRQAPAPW